MLDCRAVFGEGSELRSELSSACRFYLRAVLLSGLSDVIPTVASPFSPCSYHTHRQHDRISAPFTLAPVTTLSL